MTKITNDSKHYNVVIIIIIVLGEVANLKT